MLNWILLSLILVFVIISSNVMEHAATSPGTLTQLATSSVEYPWGYSPYFSGWRGGWYGRAYPYPPLSPRHVPRHVPRDRSKGMIRQEIEEQIKKQQQQGYSQSLLSFEKLNIVWYTLIVVLLTALFFQKK